MASTFRRNDVSWKSVTFPCFLQLHSWQGAYPLLKTRYSLNLTFYTHFVFLGKIFQFTLCSIHTFECTSVLWQDHVCGSWVFLECCLSWKVLFQETCFSLTVKCMSHSSSFHSHFLKRLLSSGWMLFFGNWLSLWCCLLALSTRHTLWLLSLVWKSHLS